MLPHIIIWQIVLDLVMWYYKRPGCVRGNNTVKHVLGFPHNFLVKSNTDEHAAITPLSIPANSHFSLAFLNSTKPPTIQTLGSPNVCKQDDRQQFNKNRVNPYLNLGLHNFGHTTHFHSDNTELDQCCNGIISEVIASAACYCSHLCWLQLLISRLCAVIQETEAHLL